jgi:hypothetical protein
MKTEELFLEELDILSLKEIEGGSPFTEWVSYRLMKGYRLIEQAAQHNYIIVY